MFYAAQFKKTCSICSQVAHLSFLVGVSSFSFSFFKSFTRASAFSFSFFSLSFSRSSFSFSFSYSRQADDAHFSSTTENPEQKPAEPNSVPFVVACPCSAQSVPGCSARAFWVVSQTQAHLGTSSLSPGWAIKQESKQWNALEYKTPQMVAVSV